MKRLPAAHLPVVTRLLGFLERFVTHESATQMGGKQMAVVFGPIFLRARNQDALAEAQSMNDVIEVSEAFFEQLPTIVAGFAATSGGGGSASASNSLSNSSAAVDAFVGPSVDVSAGVLLKVSFQPPSSVSNATPTRVTKALRVQYADTIASLLPDLAEKFGLPPDVVELYAPTPVDSVLKTDRTISNYHYLAKQPDVELRAKPGVFLTLELIKRLPSGEQVLELKKHKMALVGIIGGGGADSAAASAELEVRTAQFRRA